MVTCGSVGDGALRDAGLELSSAIGGAGDQGEVAGDRGMPRTGPENPGVPGKRRGELSLVPGLAVVRADFDLLNAAIAREGQTANFDARGERDPPERAINARDGVQRAIVPAL